MIKKKKKLFGPTDEITFIDINHNISPQYKF